VVHYRWHVQWPNNKSEVERRIRVTLSLSPTKLCVRPESMIVDSLGRICTSSAQVGVPMYTLPRWYPNEFSSSSNKRYCTKILYQFRPDRKWLYPFQPAFDVVQYIILMDKLFDQQTLLAMWSIINDMYSDLTTGSGCIRFNDWKIENATFTEYSCPIRLRGTQ
jgi:hypothetical protein